MSFQRLSCDRTVKKILEKEGIDFLNRLGVKLEILVENNLLAKLITTAYSRVCSIFICMKSITRSKSLSHR